MNVNIIRTILIHYENTHSEMKFDFLASFFLLETVVH